MNVVNIIPLCRQYDSHYTDAFVLFLDLQIDMKRNRAKISVSGFTTFSFAHDAQRR